MTPSSPLALVTDTNIWIDLEHGGLLALVFELPYQFLVPRLRRLTGLLCPVFRCSGPFAR
jgi:hypothetical protein